ncbi:MAG TPA: hypothetical protein VGJ94_16250 [Syntrophorhabdaceae bacterium]|jgi:hypothetical protein
MHWLCGIFSTVLPFFLLTSLLCAQQQKSGVTYYGNDDLKSYKHSESTIDYPEMAPIVNWSRHPSALSFNSEILKYLNVICDSKVTTNKTDALEIWDIEERLKSAVRLKYDFESAPYDFKQALSLGPLVEHCVNLWHTAKIEKQKASDQSSGKTNRVKKDQQPDPVQTRLLVACSQACSDPGFKSIQISGHRQLEEMLRLIRSTEASVKSSSVAESVKGDCKKIMTPCEHAINMQIGILKSHGNQEGFR